MAARLDGAVCDQPGKAFLAAAIAFWTSCSFEAWNSPTRSWVFAGFTLKNVFLLTDSCHSPLIKLLNVSTFVVITTITFFHLFVSLFFIKKGRHLNL